MLHDAYVRDAGAGAAYYGGLDDDHYSGPIFLDMAVVLLLKYLRMILTII